MKYLRRSIIALVLYLAAFFNIERLDFQGENVIDLRSFVYILGLAAIIITLMLPYFRQRRLLVAMTYWGAIYAIIRLAFFNSVSFVGVDIYLSLTELVFLLVGVRFAHQVAIDLYDFEQAVINITLPQVNRQIRPLNDSNDEIQTEMVRSRRHRRPMSVLVIKPDPQSVNLAIHRSVEEVQKSMMTRYVVTSLTRVVADVMRRTDMIFEQPSSNQFIVMSPETNAANSVSFAERIKAAASERLGVDVLCGIASFPDDALTFDELIREADTRALRQLKAVKPQDTRSTIQTEV
ncbi:hypothetical protein [Herpetosiphon sp. NSE202]|uniref:hypothetical protein n=1 Tax=Herpetosiphon sp. NSE202 TaxID=3351349 RepID=UPI00362B3E29